jgi:hypothetical protein
MATKTTKTKAIKGEVLPPENPDLQLVQSDGTSVSAFLSGLVPFFRGALALEREALDLLAEAERTQAPTDGTQDAVIQVNIKRATALTKRVEGYWSIAGVLHSLHRKVTAGRTRATGPAEQAGERWQEQHNAFAAAERRRVAEAQEAIRRQAEADAQAVRNRELAELERLAVEAEKASPALSERETIYVANVLSGRTYAQAAAVSGFKDPAAAGDRLANTPKIIAAIKSAREAAVLRQQATARQEAPLLVAPTRTVQSEVQRVGVDRSTQTAEITDFDAFIEAFQSGKHGIPRSCFEVSEKGLNEQARALGVNVERWPGVRYVKNTKTI